MKKFQKLFLAFCFLFIGCEKNSQHDEAGNIIVKGTNKLIVTAMHHTWAVGNVRVFLKKDATEFPGTDTTLYDLKTTADGSGVALFENLFQGNYFLYAKGFDVTWGANVMGAAAAPLNSSTLTNNEAYVTMYVSE